MDDPRVIRGGRNRRVKSKGVIANAVLMLEVDCCGRERATFVIDVNEAIHVFEIDD
jgi:hypothetical protein